MTATAPTPLIDWHTLAQVLYISVAVGIGIVFLFSAGVYSLSHFRRSENSPVVRGLSVTAMSVLALAILGVAAWGFIVIVNK
jgi:hypothetical protein